MEYALTLADSLKAIHGGETALRAVTDGFMCR
jgi:hypothetical protein